MRPIRQAVLTAIITISAICGIMYTSCQKDMCKNTTCINNGSCNGGSCTCKPGIGGNNCEILYREIYANKYKGNALYTYTVLDTNNTNHSDTANTLNFQAGTDTANYNLMSLTWHGSGGDVNMSVTLANNSASGSSFTIPATTSGTITYTGSGTISTSSASLNLIETQTGATPVTITMTGFVKQ